MLHVWCAHLAHFPHLCKFLVQDATDSIKSQHRQSRYRLGLIMRSACRLPSGRRPPGELVSQVRPGLGPAERCRPGWPRSGGHDDAIIAACRLLNQTASPVAAGKEGGIWAAACTK